MENSKIQWTDHTFNPWIGCTKVSPGCDHCYAEAREDKRLHRVQWGAGKKRLRTSDENWRNPERWNKQPFVECMACGWRGEQRAAPLVSNPERFHPPIESARICPTCIEPQLREARARVFCASLADVFDNEVPPAWRVDLFKLIASTPHLDWLLLTKRIGNAKRMLDDAALAYTSGLSDWSSEPLPNVWIGATVVNQEEADRDIPKLLATPACVRFLSCEPLIASLDLEHIARDDGWVIDGLRGTFALHHDEGFDHPAALEEHQGPHVDWVIVGGESGPGARPTSIECIASIVRQCRGANVPVFVKQLGRDPGLLGPDRKSPSPIRFELRDRKGGDIDEWPADLRVREFPRATP